MDFQGFPDDEQSLNGIKSFEEFHNGSIPVLDFDRMPIKFPEEDAVQCKSTDETLNELPQQNTVQSIPVLVFDKMPIEFSKELAVQSMTTDETPNELPERITVQNSEITTAPHTFILISKIKKVCCLYCSFHTSQLSTFYNHLETEHKRNVCAHCSYVAASENALKSHIYLKHRKRFSCKNCQFVGQNKTNLYKHYRKIHSDKRAHKCTFCIYSATKKEILQDHLYAIHSDKKPFQCSFCSYSALRPCILKKHISKKHARLCLD